MAEALRRFYVSYIRIRSNPLLAYKMIPTGIEVFDATAPVAFQSKRAAEIEPGIV